MAAKFDTFHQETHTMFTAEINYNFNFGFKWTRKQRAEGAHTESIL